jgi:nitrogen regulatory protein PII
LGLSTLDAASEAGDLNKHGNGIGFVLDILRQHGVTHQEVMDDHEEVRIVTADKIRFDLIVTIVDRGNAINVVEASKRAGAEGGTIIGGRGSGIHETAKLFGIPIEPEKDIILTLIDTGRTDEVLKAIAEKVGLKEPGKGIAFVLNAEKTVGICHLEDCSQ